MSDSSISNDASPSTKPIGLLGRVAAFKQSISAGPVKVNLYGGEQDWRALRKLVTAVAILVSGVVVGQQLNQVDQGLNDRLVAPIILMEQACEPVNIEAPVAPVKLVEVNYLGKRAMAIDEFSRVRLSKEAAKAHALHDMGLSWEDVYAVISAETAWIPRSGMGKNKVASHGLAQFEPATAKALGVVDPNDPVHAVQGAAALIKEAAEWSKSKISHLRLKPAVREAKLREGISVYYNLSSAARRQWTGANLQDLPVETQYHVANFKDGRMLAKLVERRVDSVEKTSPQPDEVSVQAGSESARMNPQLCQAAVSTGLGLVAAAAPTASPQAAKPYLVSMTVDGVSSAYVAPQSVQASFQATAQAQQSTTGWRAFFASIYQSTSFELKALQNASATSSFKDLVDRGFSSLAQGWKAAEDWSIHKGARSAMQKACGIAAFQSLAAKECARWNPYSALDLLDGHGHRSTLLMALTIFKEMQTDSPTPQDREELTQDLIDQVGFLDGGGSVELFVNKALALHAFEGHGVDQVVDIESNARFMQTLANDGYTLSDLLRLYRAALDVRMITMGPHEGAQMIMAARDRYAQPWDRESQESLDVQMPVPA